MLAIIRIKGEQFKVSEESVIKAPYMEELEPGQHVTLDEVLFLENNGEYQVGTPTIPNTKIEAEVLKHSKGKKIIVFRKQRRTGFKKKKGARAKFTELKILGLAKPEKKEKKQPKESESVPVEEVKTEE